jgi:serine/threonine-protein kinase
MFAAGFSPDGRWIAYSAAPASPGRTDIYVEPYPPTGSKNVISPAGGVHPVWSPDGKQLYYLQGQGAQSSAPWQVMSVDIVTQPAFVFSKPVKVPVNVLITTLINRESSFDVMPDGKHFLVMADPRDTGDTAQVEIEVALNWFTELNQRVPLH